MPIFAIKLKNMSRKKVVVIGSGFGGLTCGYILQKNGFDVTVLEQGMQIGGCLQCFRRKGSKFETGMHYIGSAAPGQTMDRMMRYLKLDDVKLSPLDPDGYNTVSLMGQEFRFPNGYDSFIERMAGYFPDQKDALVKYVDIVKRIASASNLNSLTSDRRDMAANTEYQTLAMDSVLESLFTDPVLRNVIAGDIPLYAAKPGKTPFSQHAYIMDFYNQSAFRIAGGSDAVAFSLENSIKSMGGRVLCKRKALKVHCNDSVATGVETDTQEFFDADYVISTVHPKRLMEMLDTNLIRPAFRSRIQSIPETDAVFGLYVKFKKDSVPYMNTNLFAYSSDTPWSCEDYTRENWPKGFLYMHMCHEDAAQWADSGVVLSYMKMSEVQQWKGTSIGCRGGDYEEFKRRRALELIDNVDSFCKGFSSSIDSWFTSTPLTYLDYTGTEDGSMYGVAKDITLGPGGRVPYRTRVPNLLMAGQNVNSHGMLGVMVGTIVTCSEILGVETMYKQLAEII